MKSGVVDVRNMEANMYGCLPCPECGSLTRWPTQAVHPTHPNMVLCDDCEFAEPIQPPMEYPDGGKR